MISQRSIGHSRAFVRVVSLKRSAWCNSMAKIVNALTGANGQVCYHPLSMVSNHLFRVQQVCQVNGNSVYEVAAERWQDRRQMTARGS